MKYKEGDRVRFRVFEKECFYTYDARISVMGFDGSIHVVTDDGDCFWIKGYQILSIIDESVKHCDTCEYCYNSKDIEFEDGYSICIGAGKSLILENEHPICLSNEKINFCPMCGRKL